MPADGFFEPEKPAGDKGTVPWSYYVLGNRQVFMMAGLWNEAPHPKTGEAVATFTVVTTAANDVIRKHDRMYASHARGRRSDGLARAGLYPNSDLEALSG